MSAPIMCTVALDNGRASEIYNTLENYNEWLQAELLHIRTDVASEAHYWVSEESSWSDRFLTLGEIRTKTYEDPLDLIDRFFQKHNSLDGYSAAIWYLRNKIDMFNDDFHSWYCMLQARESFIKRFMRDLKPCLELGSTIYIDSYNTKKLNEIQKHANIVINNKNVDADE